MFRSETIRTKDNWKIAVRLYAPSSGNNGVVIISPSAETTQDFYFDIACFLKEKNFSVVTYDFRGTGESAHTGLRGLKGNLTLWALQDTDAVILYTKNLFPKHELTVIGHGIGGEIIGLAPASQYINRLVLVSAALSASRLRRLKDKLFISTMKPVVKSISWVFGYFPGKVLGVFNNLPKGVMYEWIHWCNNDNGLFDDFSDHNYRRLQLPLLSFSFTDDWRSQQRGVKALLEHFPGSCINWYHIRPKHIGRRRIGHSGFFKVHSKQNLWCLLIQWMNDEKCDDEKSTQLLLTFKRFKNEK